MIYLWGGSKLELQFIPGPLSDWSEEIDLDSKSRLEGLVESDPIGSMSLTPNDVVPVVWLGSIVALRKLRSVS